jgi:cell division septal protein FtsQ
MFKKKSPLKATRLARKKRKKRLLTMIGVFIAAAVAVAALSWLSKFNALAITDVEVRGNSAVDTAEVTEIAHKAIAGNYIYLFSKSNSFLYPKSTLRAAVADAIPRIKMATISTEGIHTLVIDIQERDPKYVWCSGPPSRRQRESSCYFIDTDGYIFARAPIFSGSAFFAFYGLVQDKEPIGNTYLSSKEFIMLNEFVEFIKSHNIGVYALLAKDNGLYELYLTKGGKIIFQNEQDMNTLEGNVEALIKNTKLFDPKEISELEYVDLRFGNKIYFKKVGDNNVQTQP